MDNQDFSDLHCQVNNLRNQDHFLFAQLQTSDRSLGRFHSSPTFQAQSSARSPAHLVRSLCSIIIALVVMHLSASSFAPFPRAVLWLRKNRKAVTSDDRFPWLNHTKSFFLCHRQLLWYQFLGGHRPNPGCSSSYIVGQAASFTSHFTSCQ